MSLKQITSRSPGRPKDDLAPTGGGPAPRAWPGALLTSRHNPLFRELQELAERPQVRRKLGRTLLDGEHLLAEAKDAGAHFRNLLFAEGGGHDAAWIRAFPDVPAVMLSDALFRALSPVVSPTGVMAVIDVPEPAPDLQVDFAMLVDSVQDPGNMGAMLRSAAAAGVGAVYLSPGCAEAWSPKAMRGGQGAQFRLDIHSDADLGQVAKDFPGQVFAALPDAGQSLYDLHLTGPVAFAFGNEGAGLGEGVLGHAQAFSIPMPGRSESLNVAAATAVCLFERVRQMSAGKEGI